MRLVYLLTFLLLSFLSDAQNHRYQKPGYRYLKVSFNRVDFGTGDAPGYSVSTEYSVRLTKHDYSYGKHFQLGGELEFGLGSTKPALITSTPSPAPDFFQRVSNGFLEAKLSYYPIGSTFLKGLHLAIGPTGGYYADIQENYSTITSLPGGFYRRSSALRYNDYAYLGYRVTVGYEYYFKTWLIGARIDFGNNTKGDTYTTYGVKAGWKL